MNNTCRICTTEIKQMCRKNTGICGEICEKAEKQIQKDNAEIFKEEIQKGSEILLANRVLHEDGAVSIYG